MGWQRGRKIYEMRDGMFLFECPACGYGHVFYTKNGPIVNGVEQNWQYNGNGDAPTIHPSLNVCPDDPARRCHSWIKDGNITFCSDSWHQYKGQTLEIPDNDD